MRRSALAVPLVAAALALGLAACSSSDSGSDGYGKSGGSTSSTTARSAGGGATITASNFAFSPKSVPLDASTASITVRNADSIGHNLTIEDLDVDVALPGGRTTTVPVALTSGTHAFFCAIHPSTMKGTITVP